MSDNAVPLTDAMVQWWAESSGQPDVRQIASGYLERGERIQKLEAELKHFRFGENYVKQFLDAKEKCAAMYSPEEVYTDGQLQLWAEEHGFVKCFARKGEGQ